MYGLGLYGAENQTHGSMYVSQALYLLNHTPASRSSVKMLEIISFIMVAGSFFEEGGVFQDRVSL